MFKVRYVSGSTAFFTFLPSANKVWSKVMFSHVSVILSTGEGVCLVGSLPLRGLHPRRSAYTGVCIQGSLPTRLCLRGGLPTGGV